MKKLLVTASTLPIIALASTNMTPMGPVDAGSGIVIKKGKLRTALIYKKITKDIAYNGDTEVSNTKHRSSTKKATILKMKYGLIDNLSLKMAIAHVKKKSSSKSDNLENSGLTDLKIKTEYQLLNQKKGDFAFLMLSLGLKLDTAKHDKVFDTSSGKKIVPTMQLGTGSTDTCIEVGMTKLLTRSRVDALLKYIKTSKGANDYQYGDTKKADITYSYAITNKLGLQSTLSYLQKDKHKQNDKELNYTGGKQTYITPGLTYKINKMADISLGYTKYLKANMNYDNKKKVGELVAEDSFVIKFGMNF
jgi:long-subunit fatty acid transport protein